ncbi:hypothetical protein FRC10_010301 [Ceratobasidium sp. 414]|nr:hypothetical protein FRC10_010301 [Ceratobasidium sp. 414]
METNNCLDVIEREHTLLKEQVTKSNTDLKARMLTMQANVTDLGQYADATYRDTQSLIGAVGNIESSLKKGGTANPLTILPPVAPKPAKTVRTTVSSKTPSVKTAKPDKFDGSKKDKAVDFRVACMQYLHSAYPDADREQQVDWITSYPEGPACEWLGPVLEQDLTTPVPWLKDVKLFWVEFNKRFSEVNKKDHHCTKLWKLTQTKNVQDYLWDCQTFAAPLGYDDIILWDMFYDGLKDEVKNAMMAQLFKYNGTTTTFSTMADRALEIDL